MSNVLRVIPRRENEAWIKLLFQKGPHTSADAPGYPLTFPMSSAIRHTTPDDFLYVVYDGSVIGYAPIKTVTSHSGEVVGQDKEPVSSGDTLILDGPLLPLPYALTCRSFRRFRYVDANLHSVGQVAAQAELQKINL